MPLVARLGRRMEIFTTRPYPTSSRQRPRSRSGARSAAGLAPIDEIAPAPDPFERLDEIRAVERRTAHLVRDATEVVHEVREQLSVHRRVGAGLYRRHAGVD